MLGNAKNGTLGKRGGRWLQGYKTRLSACQQVIKQLKVKVLFEDWYYEMTRMAEGLRLTRRVVTMDVLLRPCRVARSRGCGVGGEPMEAGGLAVKPTEAGDLRVGIEGLACLGCKQKRAKHCAYHNTAGTLLRAPQGYSQGELRFTGSSASTIGYRVSSLAGTGSGYRAQMECPGRCWNLREAQGTGYDVTTRLQATGHMIGSRRVESQSRVTCGLQGTARRAQVESTTSRRWASPHVRASPRVSLDREMARKIVTCLASEVDGASAKLAAGSIEPCAALLASDLTSESAVLVGCPTPHLGKMMRELTLQ
ncbi:hypothetical protein EDB85DRAFT_1896548 [Lactarius pseudohatsudake]|nr:hypothetical protein EDB85DRAFT_1896548 [Lactarius pseudohatsudake]